MLPDLTPTKAAFRANKELLEVVARIILAQRTQQVQHGSIRQYHLQAQHTAMKRPIAQQPQPSCGTGFKT